MSQYSWFHAVVVILIATAGAVRAEDAASTPAGVKKPISGVDRSYMDPAVSPCTDLYDYANGAFAKTPIPGEYAAYGVNQEIDERNFAVLKTILEESAHAGRPKEAWRSASAISMLPAWTRRRSNAKHCNRWLPGIATS